MTRIGSLLVVVVLLAIVQAGLIHENRATWPADLKPIPQSIELGSDDPAAILAVIRAHPLALVNDPMAFESFIRDVVPSEFGIQSDDVLADVGSGPGAFEFWCLRNQIAFRKLYAIDKDAAAIKVLRGALAAIGHVPNADRIEVVQSQHNSIGLPASSVDLIVVTDTPIGIQFRDPNGGSIDPDHLACIRSMYTALNPGGRLRFLWHNLPNIDWTIRQALVAYPR